MRLSTCLRSRRQTIRISTSAVAEHTVILMLVLLHRFVRAHDATRSGAFRPYTFVAASQARVGEPGDETGTGRVRQYRASRHQRLMSFKPRVLYRARHRTDESTQVRFGVRYTELDDLLATDTIVRP